MKFVEINAIYTQKVAEYIANGYTINTNTMSGHQGEIAKIDVRKGTEVIRILMDSDRKTFNHAIVIIVGRCTEEGIGEITNQRDLTIWNNRLEIIEKRTFWQMEKDYREVDYYLEGEAGENAIAKGRERRKAMYMDEHPSREFVGVEKIVAKAVKRHLNCPGFKSQNVRRVWKAWNETDKRYCYYVQTLKHTIPLR